MHGEPLMGKSNPSFQYELKCTQFGAIARYLSENGNPLLTGAILVNTQ
jgi:hypothetical protein